MYSKLIQTTPKQRHFQRLQSATPKNEACGLERRGAPEVVGISLLEHPAEQNDKLARRLRQLSLTAHRPAEILLL